MTTKDENRFIYLNINKTNTKLIAENPTTCFVMGIGKTDYTVHRDADDIKELYRNRGGFIVDFSVNLVHNYHVFKSTIKHVCRRIKYRESFKYKGDLVIVKKAFVGIPNYCELVYNQGSGRTIDSIISVGEDYTLSNEKLMYIIEIEK